MFQDRSRHTEKPTARRLHKARREGNVPRSRELPGAIVLAGFLVFCHVFGAGWLRRLEGLLSSALGGLAAPELSASEFVALAGATLASTGFLLAAPLGVLLAAGVGGNLLQGPPPLTLTPLRPDLGRLNPVKGLSRLFRARTWIEALKSLLKLVLFTAIAVSAVREALTSGLPGGPGAAGTLLALLALGGKVVLRVALLAFLLAVLDYLYTRYEHRRQLMMTKQEVKEERREQEGDPIVRARVRSRQMSLSRSRMMADVAKATVVVTNPTRFAVALRYAPGETDVPRVLAKGRAKLAERIRAAAAEHAVPIVNDPPLARALYRAVPVGGFVPVQLFRAVAEVLALVLRRGRSAAERN